MVFRVDRKECVKAVPGFGDKYEVGDLGRVYSRGYELSLVRGRYVNLSGGGYVQRCDVAYLVARAFLPNAECRPYVVHKDGDKRNNRVENLEWSEEKEGRVNWRKRGWRNVVQYDMEGNCVGVYGSVKEAEEGSGVSAYLIRRCANGTAGRAGKWKFRYI